ncbi:MAG: hypothetical protein AB4372_39560 [Xenococcus sp. (in: cyanobacteria)]
MAESIMDNGEFRASGDCYGGFVSFRGRNIWQNPFPGVICSECCGGRVDLEIKIAEYQKDGATIRGCQFGKLGRNDDIYWTQWFVKVPFVGWAHFGSSTQALLAEAPPLPVV